ncbi:hypothetical protein RIF29_03929 [Crotalaria pallida]|uniref:Cation/H+ exchanger domain-containing protein n=1 Tax=Crotalaria pallida TaxID=3830 RepID=A0AAN9J0H4_CROPI
MTLQTFADFGMIIHFFRLGVEVDPKQLFRIGKEALIIGLTGYSSAIVVGGIVFAIVSRWTNVGPEGGAFYTIVITGGLTSFVVVSGLLNEMKILNSEIGRLALSTSMVSDACSVLAEKLDIIGSTLLVPAYVTIGGLNTGSFPFEASRSAGVELIIISGYIGKFIGTVIPSIHFEIQFWDSITLALIMCCRGILDLIIYYLLFKAKAADELIFSLQIYTLVLVTGFANIMVHHIYDPSKRYRSYIRRSIRDSQQDINLKILVCVHNEENVYPIINLLQVTNPTKATPLSVFVLQLIELSGRATSVLMKNNITYHSSDIETSSEPISNVFDQFEQHNKGCVTLQFLIAISPYASMHDDICYMAMDTKSNIVIMPFHKQWAIDGYPHIFNASIRILNQNVLKKAPCSVGILFERSQTSSKLLVIREKSYYEIAMIFLGGADDQEALAYSLRIAQHPLVRLTVFWVRAETHIKQYKMKNPYIDMMEHIRHSNKHNGQVTFKEEIVQDGTGTTQMIRSMEGYFNLVIVGRHHVANSPCTLGLTEWCELPELGPIGNLLATSDFTFSVLVVQQQHFDDGF